MGSLMISEPERLEALKETGVVDMPAFAIGESYVNIAAKIMNAPISAITIIDQENQWFKASKGLTDIKRTSREVAFCSYAIRSPASVLEVPDARKDPRFAENPLVTGSPGIVFYVGVPLLTASGFPMGALCVIDLVPRKASVSQVQKLRNLAKMVEKNLILNGAIHLMNSRPKAFDLMEDSMPPPGPFFKL